jgi:putative sigma-54 modulation protein
VMIKVTARHGSLSEETQERLKAKAEKLVRHFERLTSIEIVVDLQEPSKPKVDLLVSSEHKHDFVAHEQTENLLTSIESAVHKVEQQLRKYKERTIEHNRDHEGKRVEAPAVDPAPSDE